MKLLLFFYIFFFSFIGINSKEKTFSCDDVIKKNGFSNIEFRNMSNGISAIHSAWKIYIFKNFNNGMLTKIFHMKGNFLNGYYKKFEDQKLVKKVLYEEGEIISCEVEINYLVQKELKLKKLEKIKNEDNKTNYDKLIKSLKVEKTECKIKQILD